MIQFLIIYTLFLLFQSTHLYYSLLYLFAEIVLLGFLLLTYQLDLFTGFLWIAEGTIVLIFILVLMYLNSDGFVKINNIAHKHKVMFSIVLFMSYIVSMNYNSIEFSTYYINGYVILWDDFYESLNNTRLNDFTILFISYYNLNSIELILFALLLFIGTLVCVALFKGFYSTKISNYSTFFSIFNFFTNKIQYNFLRQQNLNKQANSVVSNRILRKK